MFRQACSAAVGAGPRASPNSRNGCTCASRFVVIGVSACIRTPFRRAGWHGGLPLQWMHTLNREPRLPSSFILFDLFRFVRFLPRSGTPIYLSPCGDSWALPSLYFESPSARNLTNLSKSIRRQRCKEQPLSAI